ncbi:chemotaxis protein CheW [methanotrophic endosymbiont of Bathymodiolus puteoserpentis (Logatchev)]|jgi:purine-binding chemotaxis protein CheW|uniref:chemotaxis protein CheW n=1 Tax=methanotrophic endosymbiont of Bathymodiolus puteoserpentis (Logatchev) TaxID=343235 RepID=UPI0013C82D1E|nr:chemotaxis protein CheW [methanotrophic endosymbiont of Bathymodiolus puteoserpentis (Logatchev)]SHE23626.1 CheW domain protein [methanotrophic endosymbiont of Bathymodiolus puteoserpentis (Logatchev)]
MSKVCAVAVKQLIEQELALDSYLATMLAELPSTEAIEEQERQVKKVVSSAVKVQAATVKTQEPSIELVADVVTASKALSIMPKYAQDEFSALFFKVGNLVLAAPLTDLSRAIRFDGKVTKIPQQPLWFIGLKAELEQKIGILNMAYLIQGKSRAGIRDYQQKPFTNVILTEDGQWGLACDELLTIAKLTSEQIRWRTDRKSKPWLVGTVIEQLVVVVDINELVPKRKRSEELGI